MTLRVFSLSTSDGVERINILKKQCFLLMMIICLYCDFQGILSVILLRNIAVRNLYNHLHNVHTSEAKRKTIFLHLSSTHTHTKRVCLITEVFTYIFLIVSIISIWVLVKRQLFWMVILKTGKLWKNWCSILFLPPWVWCLLTHNTTQTHE